MGRQCVTLPVNNRYIVNKTVGKLVLKFQVTLTRSADETQVVNCGYLSSLHIKRFRKDSGSPNRVPLTLFPC